jgi:hypothetical protein
MRSPTHGRSDDAYLDAIEEFDDLFARFVDLAWGHAPD